MSYKHGTGGKWTQLSFPPFKTKFACCDCGLVHTYEFKVIPEGRKEKNIERLRSAGNMTLWCRIGRDEPATSQVRRHKHKDTKNFYRLDEDGIFVIVLPQPRKRKPK